MVKKKTSVVLPGGIASLVHKAQGTETPVTPAKGETPKPAVETQTTEPVKPQPAVKTEASNDEKDRTAPAAKKLPKAEGKALAREYTMAKDYKMRDSKLATVYIDADLKSVLDRLKSASSIKMPSTALLSSIVARFVFDHEKDIKDAIFGESLL